jgi:dTDP-4-amino-4,6-dideoxygalactose transaminase
MTIPLAKPLFDEDDERALIEVLRSGWLLQGPRVEALEHRVAEYVGTPNAVAVSSGTAALHLAMLAAGIGSGDEIIVPSFTWLSTANAVEYVGAKTVFCDIDLATFNINVDDAARRITGRTKAIVAVHQFGLAADIERLVELARTRGVMLIEDAACALGTRIAGRHVGSFGEIGCFSFHPRKSITTGEGGMVTTGSDAIGKSVRRLRDIGADRDAGGVMPDFRELGYNYRMTDLQAALGITQMAKLASILAARRAAARRYDALLAALDWLQLPPPNRDEEHSYQSYVVLLRAGGDPDAGGERRNRIMAALASAGIGCRPGTHAPHLLTYYRDKYGLRPNDFPNSWRADRLSIALPLYAGITDDEKRQVADALRQAWTDTA